MTYMIDDATYHIMQSHLVDDDYVVLAWPKKLPKPYLPLAKEFVNLQLDTFIRAAQRDTVKRMAADAEYESWFNASPQCAPTD